MSATTAMFMLAGIWIGFGLLLALVMGRHGHDPFAWWLLGTLLGPLAVPLAVSSEGRQAERPERLRVEVPGRGPVDVLVGLDGSPEAAAALLTVLDLLGPQLGRLTLATVIDLDAWVEHDRARARRASSCGGGPIRSGRACGLLHRTPARTAGAFPT